MKLISYLKDGHEQLAALIDGYLYDMELLHPDLPNTMGMFLNYWEDALPMALGVEIMVREGSISTKKALPYEEASLLAPVPFPTSLRDGYAFRQHVEAARRNRQAAMIPAFDQFPVFYFSNHHAVVGPGKIRCMPDHLQELDFELEAAIVIGKQGRNISAAEADEYIAGLMIMNDFSARKLQMEEMQLQLGPAKGKDFATATGPWLVTLDELEAFETAPKENHRGKCWSLPMQCAVNGQIVSNGNLATMDWTFAELIERASYGVDLFPGDIIGSGTVGTGCFLELNGSASLADPSATPQWLQEGDTITLSIEGLGELTNSIVAEDSQFSLLANKK
ncbi:MAG TPA: fumarylacetoacetate hydrolase family protein [Chitinophagaceae bacterium]|nr:fumarylacetoacetate hydrolase family protein [Chitinophagaceae bacterium]